MNVVVKRILTTSLRGFTSLSIKNPKIPIKSVNLSDSLFIAFRKSVISHQFLRKMSTDTATAAAAAAEKPKIVFVLGAPGSGKGTQCAKIVESFNYVHLSAGDLLRAERNRPGAELAETIEEYIQAGKIIPVEVTCSLLERAMNDQMKVKFVFCFFMKKKKRGQNIQFDSITFDRLMQRRISS